ncbi:MAG TPA: hypothetical protein VFE46_10350 [Pirellulales bacterium]|nr:hypothetical protein [Pirellulales bacterium]
MSQPQDAIRPRHRRRRQQEIGNPGGTAMTSAEQSTRVIIRVPLVTTHGKIPAPHSTASLPSARGTVSLGAASDLPPSPVTTSGKQQGSSHHPSQPQFSEAHSQATAKLSLQPQPPAKANIRIHVAHGGDSSGPHSAAAAWMEQSSNVLAGMLQKRALLALALIVAAALGVVLLSRGHSHHSDQPANSPDVNAAHNQWKSETPFPADANSTPARQDGQGTGPYRYSVASSPGIVTKADQHTIGDRTSDASAASKLPTIPNSQLDEQNSWLENTFAPPPGANLPANVAAPTGIDSPAGANLPARIAPPSSGPPNTTLNSPGSERPSIYAARLEPLPGGESVFSGVNGRVAGTAVFDGTIKNPAQISR